MQFVEMAYTTADQDGIMDNAMSIALSGMQAASTQAASAASNIVNSQSSMPAGGATAWSQPVTPTFPLAYDPAAPYANMQGMIAQPNQDLPTELVNLKEAESSFRASLLAYKASSQMFKALLDATA
jgi:flagellar basal body rod protein FlgC